MAISRTILALPVLLMLSCESSDVANLDAETRDLLGRSGATRVIPYSGVPDNGNIVVGKLSVLYDKALTRDSAFRIGLLIRKKDGSLVRDFFEGTPLSDGSTSLGEGSAILTVPRVFCDDLGEKDPRIASFCRDFPALADHEFNLTFKEFYGDAYFVHNAPPGRYYIWIQTHFDASMIFQYPLIVDWNPPSGKISRHDIIIREFRDHFYRI